ncbi:acetyltransferase [Chryseobacterium sp. Leaf180]|uniref:GNAT family N-acetyltransferase n=1 Tax=Chryseobacterium sp. Leaf180 TaxID=1736289 RepID=UPI0006F74C21|nr:GNAT family N-acetyltransferase [Chryseobacterium sp. Leaf180]KQR94362.1 acetyltransferase [Chryseobacterium sp. Leaf180]
MNFNPQKILEDDVVRLSPLTKNDFEALYEAASDPEIWIQHPNKDRWQKTVFENFFEGALQSGGAYTVTEKSTGKVIGSTRFYDLDELQKSVLIGYTFYAKEFWGKSLNSRVKKMMLDEAYKYLDTVIFHVGAQNIRSQIAMERLGAEKTGEEEVAYFGESPKTNFVYEIKKENWLPKKY